MLSNRSKFNVSTSKTAKDKRTINGHTFPSDLEFKFYKYLLSQQEEGIVKEIIIQPKFLLQDKFEKYGKKIRPIEYIADFQVKYTDGRLIIYDTKGMPTPEFKLKQKMFDYKYPDLILEVISYSKIDGGWVPIDVIAKGRKQRKKDKNGTS
jgi:hypothetical protein